MNTYQAELYHHGIKGQKWGVRRYQNADGSLNDNGAHRYTNAKEFKSERKNAKKEFKSERKAASATRSGGAKFATNLLAGPFANRTYNSVIASGGSVTKARAVTAAASALGFIGHLAVSSYYSSNYADNAVGSVADYKAANSHD